MEIMRNKKTGKTTGYREKVYRDGESVTSPVFKRKVDAITWKRQTKIDYQKKKALGIEDIQSIGLSSFADTFLQEKINLNSASRTIDAYQSVINKYLRPLLGDMPLEKIGRREANKLIEIVKDEGCSISRINYCLRVLKQILNDGVKYNHLIRNQLKSFNFLTEPDRDLEYWMPDEVNHFLSANFDDPYYPLYLFRLNTGIRPGEAFGLCWDRVNLDKRQVIISRTRDRYELKSRTKTGKNRTIHLNDPAFNLLKELSVNKGSSQYVFLKPNGSLPNVRHFTDRTFKRAIERAGVKEIRFHDLRTTYASNFMMNGGNIFTLSKILGHSSVEMTAKKYADLHPDHMEGVAGVVQFDISGNGAKEIESSEKAKLILIK